MAHEGHISLPLAGIKVVSFAQLLVGPRAVQMLADLGADVIKVERPVVGAWERRHSGVDAFLEGESVFFLSVNRNQRSVTLDLKDPECQEIARRLVASADVLVENFRPGVLARLGLGYDELAATNPRLVYASAYGYGSQGPLARRPGQDLLAQARSGLPWLTGRSEDPPTPTGIPVADMHTGTLLAFGILTALFQRGVTGRGQRVEVDLYTSLIDLMAEPAAYLLNGFSLSRSQAGIASAFHPGPYGLYRTLDGYIAISMADLHLLGDLLGIQDARFDEAASNPSGKFDARDLIYSLVSDRLATAPTQAWLQVLDAHDIWCGPVQDLATALQDPQVHQNGMVIEVEHPRLGTLRFTGNPVRLSASQMAAAKPPPDLGEHTQEVLAELGMSTEQVDDLRQRLVI